MVCSTFVETGNHSHTLEDVDAWLRRYRAFVEDQTRNTLTVRSQLWLTGDPECGCFCVDCNYPLPEPDSHIVNHCAGPNCDPLIEMVDGTFARRSQAASVRLWDADMNYVATLPHTVFDAPWVSFSHR